METDFSAAKTSNSNSDFLGPRNYIATAMHHGKWEWVFKMFSEVAEKDFPEEMKCFWQQQHKILHTKSKNGYRWHPK